MSDKDARVVAEHHKAYMAAKKQPKELTQAEFVKLVDGAVEQAFKKADFQHLQVKEVEVSKTPNWIADNIETIVNLIDFDSKESLLEAWKNAKATQAKNDKIKKVSDAINILSSTFEGRTESWLELAKEFPKFVEKRIDEAVRVQLNEDKEAARTELKEKYASQLKAVEVAIPFFKEVLK